ncbi:hypothetical protein [Streptomyces pseudovenezuelae]|uniref:hypothetical protein n=1 Tax=Streptomyces pseudovenezuelae TaxID=67350 RepID=UPI002E8101E3|nr:hypothetical protein [Streptomyces pseudovenezuelae]WUA85914.1 hypothetical protein OHO81_00750 [Streptomyces pseudovenezuelae]
MTEGAVQVGFAPGSVCMPRTLLRCFVADIQRGLPAKQFGYFLATSPGGTPEEYLLMADNVRDTWADEFAGYGQYFADHRDAGFVCGPREAHRVQRYIRRNGLHVVGVFHSHQRHPALLTSVDADLHPSPELWHLIVMVRNPLYPQVRAFRVEPGRRVREVDVAPHDDEPPCS